MHVAISYELWNILDWLYRPVLAQGSTYAIHSEEDDCECNSQQHNCKIGNSELPNKAETSRFLVQSAKDESHKDGDYES